MRIKGKLVKYEWLILMFLSCVFLLFVSLDYCLIYALHCNSGFTWTKKTYIKTSPCLKNRQYITIHLTLFVPCFWMINGYYSVGLEIVNLKKPGEYIWIILTSKQFCRDFSYFQTSYWVQMTKMMEIKQNEQDWLFINEPISQGNIWNDLHRSMRQNQLHAWLSN